MLWTRSLFIHDEELSQVAVMSYYVKMKKLTSSLQNIKMLRLSVIIALLLWHAGAILSPDVAIVPCRMYAALIPRELHNSSFQALNADACPQRCADLSQSWQQNSKFASMCSLFCAAALTQPSAVSLDSVCLQLTSSVSAVDAVRTAYQFCKALSGYSRSIVGQCWGSVLDLFPASAQILLQLGHFDFGERWLREAQRLLDAPTDQQRIQTITLALQQPLPPSERARYQDELAILLLPDPVADRLFHEQAEDDVIKIRQLLETEIAYMLSLAYVESGQHTLALALSKRWFQQPDGAVLPSFFYALYRSAQELSDLPLLKQLNQFGQKVAHLHAQEPGSYLHPFVILSWPFIRPDTVFTAIQNAARLVSNKCMVGYPDDPDIWFHPELHNSIVDTRVSIDRSTNQFSLVGRRLRIGYLSPDLHSHHPVGVLLQSLFAFHDRSKFEIYCLSLKKVDSDPLQSVWRGESSSSNRTAMYFRQPDHHQCEHWMDVDSLDNQALFDLIREQLRLHIVIDLVGYCLNHRSDVLCGRPSPLQFNFLGFSSTMASNYTQYIIVDSVIAPLVDEASWSVEHSTTGSTVPHSLYSERLIRMPNSFMLSSHAHIPTFVESVLPIRGLHRSVFAEQSTCQQNCENAMKLSALRSALDMPTDALLLVCFAGVAKIPPMLPVWLRTLRMHNHTKLLLRWIPRKQRHSENASEIDVITARENIMQAAREAGVDSNRILFSDRLPTLAQHLQRLALADLAVDSFPYNQHSVSVDALFAGLPIVTRKGTLFAARVGASLLQATGCHQLAVPSAILSPQLIELLGSGDHTLVNVSLITSTEAEYDAMVNELIVNRKLLLAFRQCLEHQPHFVNDTSSSRSTLFNSSQTVKHLEHAFLHAWHRYQQKLPAAHITLPADASESKPNEIDWFESVQNTTFSIETRPNGQSQDIVSDIAVPWRKKFSLYSMSSSPALDSKQSKPSSATQILEQLHQNASSGVTPASLRLDSVHHLIEQCLRMNYTLEHALLQAGGARVEPNAPWAKLRVSRDGTEFDQFVRLSVEPFLSANALSEAADFEFDLRLQGSWSNKRVCSELVRLEAQLNRRLIVFIRTESLWKFATEIDQMCLLREPILLLGDSDVGVPSLTLAVHPVHYITGASLLNQPTADSAFVYFRRRVARSFVQNFDWFPYDSHHSHNSTITAVPLGMTTAHFAVTQAGTLCQQLHVRQSESHQIREPRIKLLHARLTVRNNVRERLSVTRAVSALRTQIAEFGVDPDQLVTSSNSFQPNVQYLPDLRRHRMVLSPAGRGIDTHRTYEALLMGCIPVMRRSAVSEFAYQHLPVLLVDRWEDMTLEFLITGYARLIAPNRVWQWQRLFAPYWRQQISETSTRDEDL